MKRDFPLRGVSRRDFIRGVFATSAAMGLGPFHALSALEDLGGSALADEAGLRAMRAVNLVAGTGALAWFTLVWPAPAVIQGYKTDYAYDNPTKAASVMGPGGSLFARLVDKTPLWQRFGQKKYVSAILCSNAYAHDVAYTGPITLPSTSTALFAAQAAMQNSLRSLVPSVGVSFQGKQMPYGSAKGAPTPTHVTSAGELAALFESSASRLMDRLATPRNRQLHEQHYRAVLRLHAMADRSSYRAAFSDAAQGVSLVGEALRQRLLPEPGQAESWSLPDSSGRFRALAELMIVTANALKLGLTAQVNLPVLNDDPHPAFVDGGLTAGRNADSLTRILQSFLEELDTAPDALSAATRLSDNVIMTVSGDTPKHPFVAANWPDNVPGNANWIYVLSQGYIRPGWTGSVNPTGRTLFDPRTGMGDSSAPVADCTEAALASVLYATSRGNKQRVTEFTRAEYSGLIS
jgi:hypothetical protein